jgi:multidrug resistance protein, MATE family
VRSELSEIFRLAWPAVLGLLAAMGMGVFDVVMVNPLGTDVVASVSLGHVWGLTGGVLAMGIARALDPIVSQAWGAQDRRTAGLALARNLVLLVPCGLFVFAWYATAPWGLRLLREPEHLIPTASAYCLALGIATLPALVLQTLRQFLASCAIIRPATVVLVGGLLLKVPLNWVLIRGWGPIPAFGATGAAAATGIVELAMVLGLVALQWRFFLEMWPERGARILDWAELRRLVGVGLNLGVQMGTEFWAFGLITVMAGWIGELALAAHTTAINLVSLVFMLPLGISIAVATRVGNLLGESRDWKAAAAAAYSFGALGAALMVVAFLLVPEPLVTLYQVSPEVLPVAVAIIGVGAAMHFFDAMQVITFGVLRGAGDVRIPTLANLFGYYVVGLPLAWWLGVRGVGSVTGLWWGLVVGQIAVVTILAWRLRHTMLRGGYRVATA